MLTIFPMSFAFAVKIVKIKKIYIIPKRKCFKRNKIIIIANY